ncbi:glutamate decarboxylase [Lentzea sp. CC55]|uniref:glutamate decarboxylase n=1 Tax=Lentzea sp. CC55 TaxID=2884909 RepID=UPI001F34F973|nr:glutamate decarboxylase [Lentzea sp. CC55]MCG8927712.1 glutamate decarboxylase [Lentzea sp. CC55]
MFEQQGNSTGWRLPQESTAAGAAYRAVQDELRPDVRPQLNLATFITTGMEPEAERLMADFLYNNTVDGVQPLHTADLAQRCVAALADLWHAPDPDSAVGTSTGGSSEACMLAGLAMLMLWRSRTSGSGGRPNLVMSTAVHVCWAKFCAYWDVEARQIPVREGGSGIDPQTAAEMCDSDTIGVVTVLGTTYDGFYEPVQQVCAALDRRYARDGVDVPVHVDAASGGMVAPFLDPALVWDFRLPRVSSINTSGHKYGLVAPGLGWIVWRDPSVVPAELGFSTDYTGGRMSTQTLSFTRPVAPVVAQYYQFLRLGAEGYRAVMQRCRDLARSLAAHLGQFPELRVISSADHLPVVAFTTHDHAGFSVTDLADRLRQRGWLVPTYALPSGQADVTVARIVCRNDLSDVLARRLADDIATAVTALRADRGAPRSQRRRDVVPLSTEIALTIDAGKTLERMASADLDTAVAGAAP